MKIIKLLTMIVIGSLAWGLAGTGMAQSHTPHQDVELSPEVLDLLRAEMREITAGIQGIPPALAVANWQSIEATGAKISSSYIMKQKLTAAQAQELKQSLPEGFKQLDAAFHQRAEQLAEAAVVRDPELVMFHYARMVETCVRCHSAYASARFSGFATEATQAHQH